MVDQCAMLCGSDPDCVAFVTKVQGNYCYLKSVCASPGTKSAAYTTYRKKDGATIDTKQLAIPGYEAVDVGMDCVSYSIASSTTSSVEECSEECQHNQNCVALVIQGANTYCWQKYQCDIPRKSVLRKVYMRTQSDVVEGFEKAERDVYCAGNDIYKVDVLVDECAVLCGSDPDCVAFVTNNQGTYCYLKSVCASPGLASTAFAIYRKKEAATSDETALDIAGFERVELGVNCAAATITSTTTRSMEDCIRECKTNKACVAIAISGADTICYQKFSCNAPTTSVTYKVYKRKAEFNRVAGFLEAEQGFHCPERNFYQLAATVDECGALCRSDSRCVAFLTNHIGNYCYLNAACKSPGNVNASYTIYRKIQK